MLGARTVAPFAQEFLRQQVRFGWRRASEFLIEESRSRGSERILVVASPREADRFRETFDAMPVAAVHRDVAMHVPASHAQRALDAAARAEADLLVSVGGGSTTGLAKAIALETGLPIVAVPTTFAGSEATPVWGRTAEGAKLTGRDPRVLPQTVIYDASLCLSMPRAVAAASALNALAHGVDALWAPNATPLSDDVALQATARIIRGLGDVADKGFGRSQTEQILLGTYQSSCAFGWAGSGLHHKICHVLGGSFNLPHAETHAIVLPHVINLNLRVRPDLRDALQASWNHSDPAGLVWQITKALGVPTSLAQIGLGSENIVEAARRCLDSAPSSNPVVLDEAGMRRLLEAAFTGRHPA